MLWLILGSALLAYWLGVPWWACLLLVIAAMAVLYQFDQLNDKIDELSKKDKPKTPEPIPDWYKERLLP